MGFDPAKAGTYGILAVDNSGNNFTNPDPTQQTGAVYKGLSIATGPNGPIFASDANSGTVLYVTAEVIRQVAILAQPFTPASAAKFLDLLNIPHSERDFTALGGARRIAPGTALGEINPVFPRYIEPEAKAG